MARPPPAARALGPRLAGRRRIRHPSRASGDRAAGRCGIDSRQVIGARLCELFSDLRRDAAATRSELIGIVVVELEHQLGGAILALPRGEGHEVEIVAGRVRIKQSQALMRSDLGEGRDLQGALSHPDRLHFQRAPANEVAHAGLDAVEAAEDHDRTLDARRHPAGGARAPTARRRIETSGRRPRDRRRARSGDARDTPRRCL